MHCDATSDTSRYVEALSVLREAHLDDNVLRGTSIVTGLRSYRNLLRGKRYLDYSSIMEEAVQAIGADADLRGRGSENASSTSSSTSTRM